MRGFFRWRISDKINWLNFPQANRHSALPLCGVHRYFYKGGIDEEQLF